MGVDNLIFVFNTESVTDIAFTKSVFKFGQTWPSITLIRFYDLQKHESRVLPHATDLKNIPIGSF
jgi:hypothetical protein